MVSENVVVNLKTGLHARPASELISFVKKYKSKVTIKTGTKQANCASIISIMALGLKCGTEITVMVDGEDEVTALPEIVDFIRKLED